MSVVFSLRSFFLKLLFAATLSKRKSMLYLNPTKLLLLCHLFLFSTFFISTPVRALENTEPFILVKQQLSNQQIIKSILPSGEEFIISNYSQELDIEVIPPFIYLHDSIHKQLSIFNARGGIVLKISSIVKYSANAMGLLIINEQKQLRVFSIDEFKIIETPTILENVSHCKIIDNVFMIYRDDSKTIENYRLNNIRHNYDPIITQGWNQLSDISSVAFNKNFLIVKDWQQLIKVTNIQGNSISLGRGSIKSFYLTKNHFIAHYGNDKVEIFNAYDKQYILTLPQVFTVKVSNAFTSLKWGSEITIINELGEIFTLQTPPQAKFSQGDQHYAVNEGDKIFIFNSSGDRVFDKKVDGMTNHYFIGDYHCSVVKNQIAHSCFNSSSPSQSTLNTTFKIDDFNVGISNWGFYQYNHDTNQLQMTFNSGKQKTLSRIHNVYNPSNSLKNDFNFMSF